MKRTILILLLPLFPVTAWGQYVRGNLLSRSVPVSSTGTVISHDQNFMPSGATVPIVNASSFPGPDIGAQINNAVSYCVRLGEVCTVEVNSGGTISTSPDLPIGFGLRFNPQAQYNLSTHWVMSHRGVTYLFNGAHFNYTLADGQPAFYIGKQISGTVSVAGTAVTWLSGPQFNDVDVGDTIEVDSGSFGPLAGNVASVNSPTSVTLTAGLGRNIASVREAFYMDASNAIGTYNGRNVAIYDLSVNDFPATAADTGLEVELADGVAIYNFTGNNFTNGSCVKLMGAVAGNYYGTHCNNDANGILIDQNVAGGFWISTSNANRFFGLDLDSSPSSTGNALVVNGSYGNYFFGLHAEGNVNHTGIILEQLAALGYPGTLIQATDNTLQISDIERNGDNTSGATDVSLLNASSMNLIFGGVFISTYTGGGAGLGAQTGVSIASTATGNVLRDTSFVGSYGTSYTFGGGTNGFVDGVSTVGTVNNPSVVVSGTGATFPAITSAGHFNQAATADFAGSCAMSSSTSCTITLNAAFTGTPLCEVTAQGNTAIAGACSVSGTTVTITAGSSNSLTWGALLIGNPN